MLIKTIKVAFLLAIVALCLFEYVLFPKNRVFLEFEAKLLSVEWLLLACFAVWCSFFYIISFRLNDLPMISLLFITIIFYVIRYAAGFWVIDAIVLFGGVTLGRGARVFLQVEDRKHLVTGEKKVGIANRKPAIHIFLVGLIVLLAVSSLWRLDVAKNFYPYGLRWTGLYDNPNIYGMLMGTGLTLAIGLYPGMRKNEAGIKKRLLVEVVGRMGFRRLFSFSLLRRPVQYTQTKLVLKSHDFPFRIVLLIAMGLTVAGLIFSFSRGAWIGTAIGLFYLAKKYGKISMRLGISLVITVAMVVGLFWHSTADTDQWYLKRLDFSRPSAQHRISAWRGALQMMWDHPLGVGWNKAVGIYDKDYSAPSGGAPALTMNSYLMLGTELGLLGLLSFIGVIWTSFGNCADDEIQIACRSGSLTLLVAFWFDGGLFDLPTAAMFWILLELGTIGSAKLMK